MIAIICAMDKELKFFVDAIEDKKETLILDYKFIQGKINQKEVVIVKCGIGKMASGIVTTLLIEHFNPQMIINSGIAGGYSKELKPLDIICVNKVGCYDIDMRMDGTVYGAFSNEDRIIQLNEDILNKTNYNVINGTVMSSDYFASNRTKLDIIFNTHYKDVKVDAVDMESYSVAYLCKKYNKRCVIIRAISDVVGMASQIDSYESFASKAAKCAFELIKKNLRNIRHFNVFFKWEAKYGKKNLYYNTYLLC